MMAGLEYRRLQVVSPALAEKLAEESKGPLILNVEERIREGLLAGRAAEELGDGLLSQAGPQGVLTAREIGCGIVPADAASGLTEALTARPAQHFAAITEPEKVGHLLRAIDEYQGEPSTCYALRILPYVFIRSSELRGATWDEIDLEKAEWLIPAERMKMKRPHIVPLARQVVELFASMRQFSGDRQLVFPGLASASRPITDVCLLNALRRMGYARGEMTIHGFRSMASTLLNEQGYNRDWIERQLAHCEKNAVRAAYNHAEYLPERRRMMQEWADYLDGLRAGAEV